MNENLVTITAEIGQVGQTLGNGSFLVKLPPIGHRLVYASFAPFVDDAGLTAQIQDDGVDVLTAVVSCAVAATPGEWKSTHFGGTNAPIQIAGGSILELDFAAAAIDTRVMFILAFLTGGN